ncbi:hypothetical protein JL720_11360 [Aureococcus anophagefferens]|nr:hypothetical protein JL720_11360 [Aureococcus anophagefferens]
MTNAFAEGDNNAYEEKAERMAEQKLLFQPMRKWYLDRRNVKLQAEHGLFPSMWMELDAWDGWKASKKAFLKFQDTGEWAGSADAAPRRRRAVAPEPAAAPAAAPSPGAATSSDGAAAAGVDLAMLGAPRAHGRVITQAFLEDGDAGDDAPKPRPRKKSRSSDRDATTKTNVEPRSAGTLRLLQQQAATMGPGGGQLALLAANQLALARPTGVQPGAHLTQEQQQELMLLQMQLRTLQERSMNFGAEFEKWSQDPDRADPPPIYGPDGKRANTPEVLFRQELQRERSELMEKISAIQPTAAAAMGDAPKRPTRKLYIPVKEFPNVCFMGLILGPRGNHHKRMERDTLCKIRIRGKGSLREGSRGKDQQRDLDDDKDDMHVWVEGPSEAHVQQAVDMIEPLLNPESAKIDELKEKHQTELAEINGTTRTEIYCHICGEKGHQQWECPAKQRSYAMANVDSEFLDFMSELGEAPGLGFQKPGAPPPAVPAPPPAPPAPPPPPQAPPPLPPTNYQQQQQVWYPGAQYAQGYQPQAPPQQAYAYQQQQTYRPGYPPQQPR